MKSKVPTLFIFSGLPGVGKSSLAKVLSKETGSTYLRIDTIEQGLKDILGLGEIEGQGYMLSHLIAQDNLEAGNDVIADSVNPWELTRRKWKEVAVSVGANHKNVEIICSNESEHKARVEGRVSEVNNLIPPTWEEVLNRDYHPWVEERVVVDTAGRSLAESFRELVKRLNLI